MSIIRTSAAILSISLVACLGASAQTHYATQPAGTSVKIAGTSSLHDWEMEGKEIGGFIELGAGVALDKTQAAPAGLQGDKIAAKAHVLIPVGSLHSKADHLPDTMDNLMKKNMKEDEFHLIDYKLAELTFKGPHTAGTPFDFEAKGDLTIAGKTKTVTFPISIEPVEGKIHVKGTAPVKMTDYGVEPPAPNFGLGMMKVGDDVKIIFDWTLKEKK